MYDIIAGTWPFLGNTFDFDIFLSHAAADHQQADEVGDALRAAGYTVYCDRGDDPELDRTCVTKETASVLKGRMRQCNVLVYVITESAHESKWMPWELGFFDGVRGKIVVYPTNEQALANASRQEYISLFPIIQPGTLLGHLRGGILEKGSPLEALDVQENFAQGDVDLTIGYRRRIQRVYQTPANLPGIMALNLEIWNAWVRLWG